MSWSDLQPQVRAAILGTAVLVVALLLWLWFVQPMRARESGAASDIEAAESQLDQMEREIESIPQAAPAERAAWQSSNDELLSRLGPESELTLLIESLVRLGEAEGVELFITSETSTLVAGVGDTPSDSARVIGAVPGASYVPLNCRVFGSFVATSRFVAQVGRLGWVAEVAGLEMQRAFPEVVTDLRLLVYFRPSGAGVSSGDGAPGRSGGSVGAQGGGNG
jgi:hypothetical protein